MEQIILLIQHYLWLSFFISKLQELAGEKPLGYTLDIAREFFGGRVSTLESVWQAGKLPFTKSEWARYCSGTPQHKFTTPLPNAYALRRLLNVDLPGNFHVMFLRYFEVGVDQAKVGEKNRSRMIFSEWGECAWKYVANNGGWEAFLSLSSLSDVKDSEPGCGDEYCTSADEVESFAQRVLHALDGRYLEILVEPKKEWEILWLLKRKDLQGQMNELLSSLVHHHLSVEKSFGRLGDEGVFVDVRTRVGGRESWPYPFGYVDNFVPKEKSGHCWGQDTIRCAQEAARKYPRLPVLHTCNSIEGAGYYRLTHGERNRQRFQCLYPVVTMVSEAGTCGYLLGPEESSVEMAKAVRLFSKRFERLRFVWRNAGKEVFGVLRYLRHDRDTERWRRTDAVEAFDSAFRDTKYASSTSDPFERTYGLKVLPIRETIIADLIDHDPQCLLDPDGGVTTNKYAWVTLFRTDAYDFCYISPLLVP